jgi:hypothetical protein
MSTFVNGLSLALDVLFRCENCALGICWWRRRGWRGVV